MKKKLKELAEWVGGTVVGDGEVEIHGVAPIEDAKEGEITFIANPKYLSKARPDPGLCGHCLTRGHLKRKTPSLCQKPLPGLCKNPYPLFP